MEPYAFLSYKHGIFGGYVEALAAHLSAAGVAVWFDREVITGDRWERIIREKIDHCSSLIVVMTTDAEGSVWVQNEINRARSERKPILPLLREGREFFALGDIQYEDVSDGRMPTPLFVARVRELVLGVPAANRDGPGAAKHPDRRKIDEELLAAHREVRELTDKARAEAAGMKASAERDSSHVVTMAEREAAEVRVSARRQADAIRGEADRDSKQLRSATAYEVAEIKATVEREIAVLRATAEREITQLRAKAAREAEEKRAEAAKLYSDVKDRRDKELLALALELAERREKAERDEGQRHVAAVLTTQRLVAEAEQRARIAEERAKEIEMRAEARRIESER